MQPQRKMDLEPVVMHPHLRLCPPVHSVGAETIDRFARGMATRAERHEIASHLLRGCPECCRHLAEHWHPESQAVAAIDYDAALDRSLEKVQHFCSRAQQPQPG